MTHLSRQSNFRSLRRSWSIACRRCSNYIFILDLTSVFKWFGNDSRKTVRESFKCWDLVRLILETWRCVLLTALNLYHRMIRFSYIAMSLQASLHPTKIFHLEAIWRQQIHKYFLKTFIGNQWLCIALPWPTDQHRLRMVSKRQGGCHWAWGQKSPRRDHNLSPK